MCVHQSLSQDNCVEKFYKTKKDFLNTGYTISRQKVNPKG